MNIQGMNWAEPRPLPFTDEEKQTIAQTVKDLYDDRVEERNRFTGKHLVYDEMFRGQVNNNRRGPWEDSANLHVQMPYWLVDSINNRLMMGVWGQTPLVIPTWEEDDDEKPAKEASKLVEWHLQAKRMDARRRWSRASKIRLIHGSSVCLISYANTEYSYRVAPEEGEVTPTYATNPDGSPQFDPEGNPIPVVSTPPEKIVTETKYRGPVITPLEWDDVVVPVGCMNLQPLSEDNPGGATDVIIRQHERLQVIKKKHAKGTYVDALSNTGQVTDLSDWDKWVDSAPDQQRSTTGRSGQNTSRERAQDRAEGINRANEGRKKPEARPNPEYEILTYFGVWEHDGEFEEMVFFVSLKPLQFLGGFFLSDYYFKGERPLLEMHYQTVSTRFYSMGVCEIVQHLSAELDTLHNMRLDVGFATNLPFFFYRAASGFDPNKVKIRPMKGIPVDNPADFVFPQTQNVTSFYHQEETLLLTIIERVMGVTDLFLGVSPTQGASARHATGFVGTQQEAEARMTEILDQDAGSFSFLCRTIYNLEYQYGPEERSFRLLGKTGAVPVRGLTKKDITMIGDYDFRLGANLGTFSSQVRQQKAQGILQTARTSPISMQNPGYLWESEKTYYESIGVEDYEKYIGPKENVAGPTPKSQDEENAQMSQFAFGIGKPAPISPSDDHQAHIQEAMMFLQSPEYQNLGQPNMQAIQQHIMEHNQAMMMQQMMAMMAAQNPQPQAQPGGGANTMERAGAQIGNVPVSQDSLNSTQPAMDQYPPGI